MCLRASGVYLQAPDSVGQSLCGRVHSAPRPAFTRFTGVYADGGVDTISQKYVVDNAFSTTKWLSYCSEKGSNVHCCAVLLVRVLSHLSWLHVLCNSSYAVQFGADEVGDGRTMTTGRPKR